MNEILKRLIDTGDIVDYKTLVLLDNKTDAVEYYVTEYSMNSRLGPFKWWCTWLADECTDEVLRLRGSFYKNVARARMYFPPALDTRIPPENREGITEWLAKHGLDHYDKWDMIVETGGYNVNRVDHVKVVEPRHCTREQIHAIEEIWDEYNRGLGQKEGLQFVD